MDECCAVCADPLEWTGYGPCGHVQTCSKCVARLRFILKDKRCAICQQETDVVFFTRYAGEFTRKMTPEQFHSLKGGREFRYLSIINGYFDDVDQFQSINYTHPDVGADQKFQNLRSLKQHIKEHLGKQFCEICLTGRKAFVCEQLLYTQQQAKKHLTKGDLVGPLAEGGFKGHPMCEFCRSRFFSETELFKHNSERHETCFLCRRDNPHIYRYYRDWADLEEHFKKSHFPCPHPQCMEARFIVFRSEAELKQHFAAEHERREGGRAQRNQANLIETNFQYRRPNPPAHRGRGQFQLTARQEYAPSSRGDDGLMIVPDPNGFTDNRLIQLTEEDFPSFGDVPCPTQSTWPVKNQRSGARLRNVHFPSLPGQSTETQPHVVQRSRETMASKVAASRSPALTRPARPVANPNLQAVRRPASMPSLQQEVPSETTAPNWPVQKGKKEPAQEAKAATTWVTLSKGGTANDFPSLTGEESTQVTAKSKWGRSQPKPRAETPPPAPKPTVPSISDTSAFPSLGRRPVPFNGLGDAPSGTGSVKVSEGIKSANKVLIKKLKDQMDAATFHEFHSEADVFLKDGLSAEVFHRHLVDRGLAHYISEVASLCPLQFKGQELLSIHARFIEHCKEDPNNAPIVVPLSVLEQSYSRVRSHPAWHCPRCSTLNLADADFCEACDASRHANRSSGASTRPDPVPFVYRRHPTHPRTLFGVDDAKSGTTVWSKRRS